MVKYLQTKKKKLPHLLNVVFVLKSVFVNIFIKFYSD